MNLKYEPSLEPGPDSWIVSGGAGGEVRHVPRGVGAIYTRGVFAKRSQRRGLFVLHVRARDLLSLSMCETLATTRLVSKAWVVLRRLTLDLEIGVC